MPRWGIVIATLVFAFAATQILVPNLAEREVESRLTDGGGSAQVTLGAIPALRLLWGDGERFEVEASGLDLAVDERADVFEKLDGFAIVDVSIENSSAGPIALESFSLRREALGTYRVIANGETTASELTAYGLDRLEVPGTSLLDLIIEPFVEELDEPVPITLDMELTSEEGRVQVVSGGGEVGGFSTGPLAELITSAIVVRL